jgi:triacylglycerol esterase/lipase EstA (alpha/beta hydrolase family)
MMNLFIQRARPRLRAVLTACAMGLALNLAGCSASVDTTNAEPVGDTAQASGRSEGTGDVSPAPPEAMEADAGWATSEVQDLTEGADSEPATDAVMDEVGPDTLDGPADPLEDTAEPDDPLLCGLTAGALPAPEGAYIPQGQSHSGTRAWCQGVVHALAGAAGSTLQVTLTDWPDGQSARVRVEDLLGAPLGDWATVEAGDAITASPPLSGEVLLRIEPEDPEADANPYTLEVSCDAGCDLEYTRYPVLLMHGMAGTETYINVLDYWFQIEDVVLPPGFNVQIREVESFQGTQVRGAQWLVHVEAMLAQGIGRKFNLIGHSQGGIDARLIAATKSMTGRIASVVTVSAPHHGSPTAQVITGTFDLFPIGAEVLDGLTGILGGLIGLTGDDLAAQIADLTPEAMVAFNADYPDVPGVYYASYAGKSCGALDLVCQWSNKGEVVDLVFTVSHAFITLAAGDNDGMVPVESAKWGDYRGTIPADHMDEVGQIADFFNLSFDHKDFYLEELRRLAELGL